jgi:hypothetical protein
MLSMGSSVASLLWVGCVRASTSGLNCSSLASSLGMLHHDGLREPISISSAFVFGVR